MKEDNIPTITPTKSLTIKQFLSQLGNKQYRSDLFNRRTPAATYLLDNAETKTIGKEITPYVQSGLNELAEGWQDTMWKARRGMLGPHSFIGAHAIDTAGKLLSTLPDIPVDKGISHGLHNWLGIDKPLADIGGEVGEFYLTRKGFKLLSKVKPKHLGITQTIEPYTKGLNPVQEKTPPIKVTSKNVNVTPKNQIIEEAFLPGNSLARRQIPDLTTGGLGALMTPIKSKQTANVENVYWTGSGEIDWSVYGYKKGVIPNQVQKASRVSPEIGKQVATDLDGFYTRVDKYITSREGSQAYSSGRAFDAIKTYPMYWRNPHTGGLYKAAWNAREQRLTVRPVTRGFLENQQSSNIQKYANKLSKEQIYNMNLDLESAYEEKVQELTDRLAVIDADMPGIIRHAGSMGKDGSTKSAVMNSAMSERNSIIAQLENITLGKYYTEHGYYLNSEKIRNQVVDSQGVPIGESTEFQLGDRKNQTPVFEPGKDEGFSALKTRIETAIDSVDEGFYLYPNLVVNYNPALSGEREYIIRIEDLSTVRMGRDIKGVLSGKAILEINYNDTELVKRLSTTDGIREWLAEKGIEPVAKINSRKPDPIRVRDSMKPTTSASQTRENILNMLTDVFDNRVPKTIQGLLGFEVPEYEVVKPRRGRPPGSPNKPKPDQLKLDL